MITFKKKKGKHGGFIFVFARKNFFFMQKKKFIYAFFFLIEIGFCLLF